MVFELSTVFFEKKYKISIFQFLARISDIRYIIDNRFTVTFTHKNQKNPPTYGGRKEDPL